MNTDLPWWIECFVTLVIFGVGLWTNAWAGRRSAAGAPVMPAIAAAQLQGMAFLCAGVLFGLAVSVEANNLNVSGMKVIAAVGFLAIGIGAAGTLRPILREADGLPPSEGDVNQRDSECCM